MTCNLILFHICAAKFKLYWHGQLTFKVKNGHHSCVCVLVHAEFALSIPRYIYIYMEHYISCYIGSKTIFNESFACSFYIVEREILFYYSDMYTANFTFLLIHNSNNGTQPIRAYIVINNS